MRTLTQSAQPDPGRRGHKTGQSPAKDGDRRPTAQEFRVGVLVDTIQHEIIPRLMLAHRADPGCPSLPEGTDSITPYDVEKFVRLVLSHDEELATVSVQVLRARGWTAEDICLELLAPTARRLGEMWEADLCDFTEVTFGLGRLQHILRDLGASFDQRQGAPANGRRILLVPAPGEQHTFGLVMVAEFFRHDGWDVEVSLEEDQIDPAAATRAEWFDLVGFSVGSQTHLQSLRRCITQLRSSSVNPRIGIMLGGSLCQRDPAQVAAVGADASAPPGRGVPAFAESLVAELTAKR